MEKHARVQSLVVALSCLFLSACSSDGGSAGATPTHALGAPTATRSSTPGRTASPTVTSTPTPPPGVALYRVAGYLLGSSRGYPVTLQPTGRSTTSIDTYFEFDDVAPGDYVVDVDDSCGASPCFADQAITVVDRDVVLGFHYDACPTPALHPPSGPPGTSVGFGGRCYYLHSGGRGYVFLGDVRVGEAAGNDTIGNYGAHFVVPLETPPGDYVVTISSAPDRPVRLFSATFTVTAGP